MPRNEVAHRGACGSRRDNGRPIPRFSHLAHPRREQQDDAIDRGEDHRAIAEPQNVSQEIAARSAKDARRKQGSPVGGIGCGQIPRPPSEACPASTG